MIPILYENNETAFVSNGLGRLRDCISCIVTEERNSGIYECDFEYPVTGLNYDLIQIGRIVGVTHDETDDIQPFDIVSYSKPIDGVVTFHCTHISYRQSYLTVKTGTPINSLADAFTLFGTSEPSNPFTYETDKTSTGFLACADGTPRTVRQMLGGVEGSVLDAYGGEYEWDKWRVILHSARGQMRDFSVRYSVNMTEFNDEMDSSGTYSSVIPYWTNNELFVVGDKVDSLYSTVTGRGECVPLDVSDKFENQPTKAQVETEAANILSSTDPHIPTQTINVSFVRLQDLGYNEFENLLQCKLCDTINVIFPYYGMQGKYKIVKTVWNVLADRYDEMELGALSTSLSEALGIQSTLSQESLQTDKSIYAVLHSLSSDLSLSTTAKKVPLTTLGSYKDCQLSSNGIKVKDKGIYVIEGSAYFSTGFTANDLIHLNIYVNSSSAYDVVDRAYNASPYKIFVTGEVMVSLNADDVVYLYARNQTASRGTVGDHLSTRLTLHRIALA